MNPRAWMHTMFPTPMSALLFENHPHPMWVFDRESLKFVAVNSAAQAAYGYSRAEFLDMTILDIRPAAEVDRLLRHLRDGTALATSHGTWIHRLKSGQLIYADVTAHSLEFDNRPARLVVSRDVTRGVELERERTAMLEQERRLRATAEESARRAEQLQLDILRRARELEQINMRLRQAQAVAEQSARLLKLAGATAKFGGWCVDLRDGEVELSDQTAAIHGLPAGTRLSLEAAFAFYAPEYRDTIRAAFTACAKDGVAFKQNLEIINTAGERVWVRSIGEVERDDSGAIVVVYGAFQDISELAAAQAQSRSLADRLH